jgi:hypothetical protein
MACRVELKMPPKITSTLSYRTSFVALASATLPIVATRCHPVGGAVIDWMTYVARP